MTSRNNHSPRDTSTGKVNEAEIENFLRESVNESVYEQAEVGTQFATGKKHIVDVLLGGSAYRKTKKAKRWTSEHKGGTLISLKYPGTAVRAPAVAPTTVSAIKAITLSGPKFNISSSNSLATLCP